ncbi:MAG TPA: hypothetical protein VF808_16975 [Ktedonobacterales bacterium]
MDTRATTTETRSSAPAKTDVAAEALEGVETDGRRDATIACGSATISARVMGRDNLRKTTK